jgi:hypothetical protein
MNEQKQAAIAERLAGRSFVIPFVFQPRNVYSGRSEGWAWRVPQAGKPSAENIRKHVELHNKSLESDGVNSHIGRRGAIYGGSILNQKTGEIVAEWEDRGIVSFYKNKPAFEIDGSTAVANELTKVASLLVADAWSQEATALEKTIGKIVAQNASRIISVSVSGGAATDNADCDVFSGELVRAAKEELKRLGWEIDDLNPAQFSLGLRRIKKG